MNQRGGADFPHGGRSGFVALVGWTNVGKSTLLNRLVGTKLAAVAEAAQTTRRRITGVRTIAGRGQIVFVDTPGFHRPRFRLNRIMVETTRQTLRGVDLIAFVVDAARGLGPGDRSVAGLLPGAGGRRVGVLNKIDLVRPKSRLLPLIEAVVRESGCEEIVPVSAKTGEGCDRLSEVLLALLPPGPPLYPEDYLTDQPERVIAAEWIREKLLAETRQELPHATAVLIERWERRPDGLVRIEASILVERESQKRIVVGRGGSLLKRVGSAARPELERLLGCRVFLGLWVRVRGHWRDDARVLGDLGLN